ncbi:cytochrome c3 family protein [Motiliproteus sp. SC1-56]|uniref:cytochrome c3 family protein n=1 Tax=Motiliproteus sp. SC1-56 TaxID=2799565 RepID=UPI001A8F2844
MPAIAPSWKYAALLVLAVLAVFKLATFATAAFEPGEPLATVGCGSCHLAGQQVRAGNAELLRGTEEQLCIGCHQGALTASHPSGVQPSMEVPSAFPLDWKGDLTCSTCHQVHNARHGRLRSTKRGEPFCTACHASTFFDHMADGGGSVIISGHLAATLEPDQLGLDPFSIQCMGCHGDKSEDPRQRVSVGANRVARHGATNHPVGVAYPEGAADYQPVAELTADIELPQGMVSCVSCHRGYSSDHGAVSTPMRGSQLCFQCHLL